MSGLHTDTGHLTFESRHLVAHWWPRGKYPRTLGRFEHSHTSEICWWRLGPLEVQWWKRAAE